MDWSEIPTFNGVPTSTTTWVTTTRLTGVDIMCVSNTHKVYVNAGIPGAAPAVRASMPYKPSKTFNSLPKGSTHFQRFKLDDGRRKQNDALRNEMEEFFFMLQRERAETSARENWCATRIQAIFRGFRRRHEMAGYPPRKIVPRTAHQMQDDLCRWAAKLHLKPIKGLSLEARSKTSRRYAKIQAAAALRLQRFCRMIVARGRARRRMENVRNAKMDRGSKNITKFFRTVKVTVATRRAKSFLSVNAAIVLQSAWRSFLALRRCRKIKQASRALRRQNEAVIIIIRNLWVYRRRFNKEERANHEEKLRREKEILQEAQCVVSDARDIACDVQGLIEGSVATADDGEGNVDAGYSSELFESSGTAGECVSQNDPVDEAVQPTAADPIAEAVALEEPSDVQEVAGDGVAEDSNTNEAPLDEENTVATNKTAASVENSSIVADEQMDMVKSSGTADDICSAAHQETEIVVSPTVAADQTSDAVEAHYEVAGEPQDPADEVSTAPDTTDATVQGSTASADRVPEATEEPTVAAAVLEEPSATSDPSYVTNDFDESTVAQNDVQIRAESVHEGEADVVTLFSTKVVHEVISTALSSHELGSANATEVEMADISAAEKNAIVSAKAQTSAVEVVMNATATAICRISERDLSKPGNSAEVNTGAAAAAEATVLHVVQLAVASIVDAATTSAMSSCAHLAGSVKVSVATAQSESVGTEVLIGVDSPQYSTEMNEESLIIPEDSIAKPPSVNGAQQLHIVDEAVKSEDPDYLIRGEVELNAANVTADEQNEFAQAALCDNESEDVASLEQASPVKSTVANIEGEKVANETED